MLCEIVRKRKTNTVWSRRIWKIQPTSEYKQRSRSTNIENKLVVTSGEREGMGQHRGREIRCTKYYV